MTTGRWQNALFGVVIVANAAIGDRPGAAGQADPRPAGGAQRAPGPRRCATAPSAEVPVGDVVADDLLDLRSR